VLQHKPRVCQARFWRRVFRMLLLCVFGETRGCFLSEAKTAGQALHALRPGSAMPLAAADPKASRARRVQKTVVSRGTNFGEGKAALGEPMSKQSWR
jgi:hypothetical protein